MKLHHIKWKIKQFPNLIIRLFTLDHYYICEECHQVHKRDGTEIRFDDIMSNRWWRGGVCRKEYEDTMNRVVKLLRDEMVK